VPGGGLAKQRRRRNRARAVRVITAMEAAAKGKTTRAGVASGLKCQRMSKPGWI
jgi:hypothetical protein